MNGARIIWRRTSAQDLWSLGRELPKSAAGKLLRRILVEEDKKDHSAGV